MNDLTFYSKSTGMPLDPENPVCRQYTGWYARVATPGIVPYIKKGSRFIALEKRDNDPLLFEPDSLGGYAGLLILYDSLDQNRPLLPKLSIESSSLVGGDFEAIINRLQLLAFSFNSPVTSQKQILLNGQKSLSGHTEIDPDERLIEEANQFIQLCETTLQQCELISRKPARETRLLPQIVDTAQSGKPLSANIMQRQFQRPFVRRIEVLLPQETPDTAENQFVVFVIDMILRDAPKFIAKLKDRIEQIKQTWGGKTEEIDAEIPSAIKKVWAGGRAKAIKYRDQLINCRKSLEKKVFPIENCKKQPSLTKLKPGQPDYPSLRLTNSHEYGPVFQAFYSYEERKQTYFLPLKRGLEQALVNMAVHKTCDLYELWVFLEVYETLISRFGFRPKNATGVNHPLQYVDIIDGEIIQTEFAGKQFELVFEIVGEPERKITATLWYDKKVFDVDHKEVRPDFRVVFEYQGEKFSFCIDAKYRDYDNMDNYFQKERGEAEVDTIYEYDLMHTAKKKYGDGLKSTASFIAHSDKAEKYTYWGGTNPPVGLQQYPNHKFGAICVTPAYLINIERLLKCFLMFHMGIHDVCWNCCKIADAQEKRNGKGSTVGHFYQCSLCSRCWVSTWCQGNTNHPILKLGKIMNFHQPSKKVGSRPSSYDCPTCGGEYRDPLM